eukprot:scaffold45753_cov97-Phaeocystis_antarctica.AAC.6
MRGVQSRAAGGFCMNRDLPSCTSTDLLARAAAGPVCLACLFLPLAAAPPVRFLANIASFLRISQLGRKFAWDIWKPELGQCPGQSKHNAGKRAATASEPTGATVTTGATRRGCVATIITNPCAKAGGVRAVDQSRINFSRRMGSRRPSNAVPGCQHLGSSLGGREN